VILVVGATGLLGRRICRSLVRRDKKVRALVREGSSGAAALRELGIETIVGDLKDRSSLDRACRGVTEVVTTANAIVSRLPGDSLTAVDRDGQIALVRSAHAAGVDRFMYVSISPVLPADNLFIRCKREVEIAVRTSGMGWTILQPAAFMDVHLGAPLGWDYVKGRARILGSPDVVKSYVSADDVAEFAARAIDLPSADGRDLHLTGPEPLTAAEALAIAERVTGLKFKVQRIPTPALRVLSALLRPFAPVPSSLMAMAAANPPDIVDMTPLTAEFGVKLTPFSEFVHAQIAR
jgi:uncharacterized protein YbjT (DUF2867 family)